MTKDDQSQLYHLIEGVQNTTYIHKTFVDQVAACSASPTMSAAIAGAIAGIFLTVMLALTLHFRRS